MSDCIKTIKVTNVNAVNTAIVNSDVVIVPVTYTLQTIAGSGEGIFTLVGSDGSQANIMLQGEGGTSINSDDAGNITISSPAESDSFGQVSVNGTLLEATIPNDILTITAGSNITLTPVVGTNTFTISSTVPSEYVTETELDDGLDLKANIADLSLVATSGLYSDLTGTPTSLPASDVYSWAKQPTKPTYTSSEVGLGNVPNVDTNNQTPTWAIASALANLVSGEALSIAFGKIAKAIQSLISHIANISNPHSVTKSQVGLGSVDDTADINKPISTATQNALNLKVDTEDLADVAFSGLYSDLIGKPPSLPANGGNSDTVGGYAPSAFATSEQGALADTSVQYVAQTLTEAQQAQARSNINAAKPDGVYKLIETIKLTENVASIVRTQEPDGTPYKFKAIGVVVSAKIGSVNCGINMLANYNATRLNAAFINGAISTSIEKYGYTQIYPDFGVWTAIGSTSVNGFGWTVTQVTGYSPMQAFAVKESENPYCTQAVIQVNIPDATIPAGTVIKIYGVRA